MKEIHTLLGRRWILKRQDPELYFKLKDNMKLYKPFIKEKLGYSMIVNPLMVKVEKIPGKARPWMGIRDFDTTLAYLFFCLVLMYLEELDQGEQFVLSQVTDYIQANHGGEEAVDWTSFTQRKTLIKVLKYCSEMGMIIVNDGDESSFAGSAEAMAVLYENTGASKYFMRRFPVDIHSIQGLEDFDGLEWQTEDLDRGLVRRHRVYRRLVMEPVVYEEGDDDQDYLYIKNQRSVIAHDIEKYLDCAWHLHLNGAMVMMKESDSGAMHLPSRKNISDIVLQVCCEIRELAASGSIQRDRRDGIRMPHLQWTQLIEKVRDKYGSGWSKTYREAMLQQVQREIEETMADFGLLALGPDSGEVLLLPACGKVTGDYSADYWRKRDHGNETMADQ